MLLKMTILYFILYYYYFYFKLHLSILNFNILQNIPRSMYIRDYHVPDLYAFNKSSGIITCTLYKEGKIVLQDKVSKDLSCFDTTVHT